MAQTSETRAKLLAAARRAFAELGYAKARVEDVVTAAGVGHGTFYAYFPNKQAALAALVREHAGTLEELAMKPWRAGDVRASLAEVLGGLADLYERDADMLLLWTEAAVHDPELEAILDEVRRQFVERIARKVERAANNQGWLGSGVAGAIRRAAGDEVEADAVAQGPWEVGGAVRTGPGRLSLRGVKSIVHAAAMGAGVRATPASVAAATGAALDLAAAEGLSSIALPALGTGVGGLAYPDCAAAMAGALRRHCAGPSSLRLVVFALYEAAAVEEFAPALVHDLDG